MTNLRKDAIINTAKLIFKEHDVYPTDGIESLQFSAAGTTYKICLRKGQKTSKTWRDCMDDYWHKVKAEEKTAQTLALIHTAGLQGGYDTGWSFELMHNILNQSRHRHTMIPNFSLKFLIAIKHQQITARRKYSLPFFNS